MRQQDNEILLDQPKITWINHAGYIVEYKDMCLLVDPWFFGTAFNEGWALVAETKLSDSLLRKVNHIWCSHEHPDHFSIPTLKKIVSTCDILPKFLFRSTKDKRVKSFCESLGFEVIELKSTVTHHMSPDVEITSFDFGSIDSMHVLKLGEFVIANMNDCVVQNESELELIARHSGKCNILFTQFSYASWISNPEQPNKRREAVLEKRNEIRTQVEILNPEIVIPFASFIYFAHEENEYMNDQIPNLYELFEYIQDEIGVKCLFMYPNDKYVYNSDHFFCGNAIEKYTNDYNQIHTCPKTVAPLVSWETLKNSSRQYISRIREKNNVILVNFVLLVSSICSDGGARN